MGSKALMKNELALADEVVNYIRLLHDIKVCNAFRRYKIDNVNTTDVLLNVKEVWEAFKLYIRDQVGNYVVQIWIEKVDFMSFICLRVGDIDGSDEALFSKKETVKFEIFFNDLNDEAKKNLLKTVGISDAKEANWDINMCPIAIVEFDK